MRLARRLVVGLLLALASLVWGATAAFAYWTATGTGTGTGTTATLNPPTNVSTSYTAGASSVGLSWTAPDSGVAPQGYVVHRLQGSTATTVCASPVPSSTTSCTDSGLSAGAYTWTVTAVYQSWTATGAASDPVTVITDLQAPAVTVTHVNGSARTFPWLTNQVVSFGGTCGTALGDSAVVRPLIGGAATAPPTAACSGSGTWTIALASAWTTPGTISLSATQSDSAGNLGTATPQSVDIDRAAPTVSSILRAGPSPANAGPLTWTVTFSEPVTGVSAASFQLLSSGLTGAPSMGTPAASGGAPATSWIVPAAMSGVTAAAGTLTLNLLTPTGITDAAGNALATASFIGQQYSFDTVAPSVTTPSSPPATVTTAAVPMAPGTASDTPGSGVATTRLERSTATLSLGLCQAFSTTWAPVTLESGSDTGVTTGTCARYRQQAVDTAGNIGFSTITSAVKVDTSPPSAPGLVFSAMLNASATGNTVYFRSTGVPGGTFTVTPTASDDQSAIASYGYPVLGSGWTGTTGTAARTYTWSGSAGGGSYSVTATNGVGLAASTAFTVAADNAAPSVPSPTATVNPSTGTVTVALSTPSDTGSGVASTSVLRASTSLVNGVCDAASWTQYVQVTLTTGGVDGTAAEGSCYRYQQQAVDAVGNVGVSTASAVVAVDTRPRIVSVTLGNGGASGSIGRGDTIRVVFDRTIQASSMCGAWTSNTGQYLLDGNSDVVVSVVQNGTADYLAVTSTGGGAASCVPNAFGQLSLGNVVGTTTTFVGNGNNASSLQWDGPTLTLTIRLGSGSAPAPTGPTSYANTGVTDPLGRKIANSPFAPVTGAF